MEGSTVCGEHEIALFPSSLADILHTDNEFVQLMMQK